MGYSFACFLLDASKTLDEPATNNDHQTKYD